MNERFDNPSNCLLGSYAYCKTMHEQFVEQMNFPGKASAGTPMQTEAATITAT